MSCFAISSIDDKSINNKNIMSKIRVWTSEGEWSEEVFGLDKINLLKRALLYSWPTEDEYDELVFGNDIENMPHDIFDTYDEPSTEKENKEYIKKLINDSEVILYLLDARDVLYFLDKNFEKMINADNKLLIYIINKIDLVSQNYLKKYQNIYPK